MYIKCLIAAISLVTVQAIAGEQTTPLLPEAAKVFEINIDEQTMDNNAYVALQGLEAPIGLDYKAIGKAYTLAKIKKEQQAIQQIKQPPSIKINTFYQGKQPIDRINRESIAKIGLPCYNLINLHCVKESLAKQTALQEALAQNKVLLERYQQIIKLPNYNTYYVSIAETPAYEIRVLQQIHLLQAIELIDKGNIEQGLGILQQEIDFSKRILQDKESWIDYSIAITRLLDAYHVVSELLDSPKLANHLTDPKLLALLKPLTIQEQQTILINQFKSYRNLIMVDLYFKNEQLVKQEFEEYADDKIKDYMKKHNIPIKFDRNRAINMLYQSYQPIIEKITDALPNAKEIEQSLIFKKEDRNYDIAYYDNLYKNYGTENFITALYGAKDIKLSASNARLYNLQSYLTLINVKLQIKQAAISKDKVPAFLVKLEEQTKNPYIKQPFYWDAEKQILAIDWFKNYLHDREWAGDRAEVYIDFAQ